jgi:hypothetical protein
VTARLCFPLAPLQAHISHAQQASRHFGGLSGEVGPALEFVKDEGIYLMSNGDPADGPGSGTLARPPVVYAEGYDPTVEDRMAVWERARAAVGGDDFVEFIELDDQFLRAFDRTSKAGYTHLAIDVTAGDFTIGFLKSPE